MSAENLFKFAATGAVLWPVEIPTPNADGSGTVASHTIKLRFARLLNETDEMSAFVTLPLEQKRARLAELIEGWEGVLDPDDKPVPFSPEKLAALLCINRVLVAAVFAYVRASNGEAAAKNSSSGLAGSTAAKAP